MKIDIEDNIVSINLNEEEADKIKAIYSGGHEHFQDEDKEIIINKQ